MNFLNEFPFEFYGETFSIYYLDNGHFYIPVRRVCEAIGVEFTGQRRNIMDDEAIADDTIMLALPTNYPGRSDRDQNMFCLDVEALPMWMGKLTPSKVKPEHREKLRKYRREMKKALWAYFRTDILPRGLLNEFIDPYLPPDQREFHEQMDEARSLGSKIDAMLTAQDNGLAKSSEILETLEEMRGMLGKMSYYMAVEDKISPAQKERLQKMVREIAGKLHDMDDDSSRKLGVWIAGTWTQLFNHVHVTKMEDIAASQFIDSVQFLMDVWRKELPGFPFPVWFNDPVDAGLF